MLAPCYVFRLPGDRKRKGLPPHERAFCVDEAAHAKAKAAGWHDTIEAAIAAHKAPQAAPKAITSVTEQVDAQTTVVTVSGVTVDDAFKAAPVGRAALEAKAKALGVAFDGRTGDKTLAARIAEAEAKA